ncbi:MAG: RNA 3'-terminal phosphate cyclase [Planctomycetes bacterium]|nr:RNA 3'-terminal phosphate cyclase [Planctomycetota bacterium]
MSKGPIAIDGSRGEGGGQILRTSLALSLVTGTPFRIERIRAGREKPGLLRQHLTAVQAAVEIGSAAVEGAAIGSAELTFRPGARGAGVPPAPHGADAPASRGAGGTPTPPEGGAERLPHVREHAFAVGSAGSATLVLQTVLPALLTAAGPSRLTLEGGTHNPFAPPFDFLNRVFLPLIGRMGPKVTATLERPGFYPAGGGKFRVEIAPAGRLAPIDLMDRGEIRARRARAVVTGLPRHVAERELSIVKRKLGWEEASCAVEEIAGGRGPGNVLTLEIESEHITEIVTGFGERGVTAEAVATKAVDEARHYLAAGVPVGEHLADQLLLPFALAGGGSFRTMGLSRHAKTNIEVIREFLPVRIAAEMTGKGEAVVRVGQAGG